jgi:adenylyltransferase/sulfurtransferase
MQSDYEIPEITPAQLQQRIETGEPMQLIDVREPFEWDIANLGPQGAKLIPMGEIAGRLDELDRDADLIVHCRSGGRSEGVVRYLKGQGFDRVWNLQDGILGWAREVDTEMPTY